MMNTSKSSVVLKKEMSSKVHKRPQGKAILSFLKGFRSLWILISLCCCNAEQPTEEKVAQAIRKGVTFLIENQNSDGSWGGIRKTKGLSIFAPIPGAHDAFKAASSSLALSGLIAHEGTHQTATSTINKGEKWLFHY